MEVLPPGSEGRANSGPEAPEATWPNQVPLALGRSQCRGQLRVSPTPKTTAHNGTMVSQFRKQAGQSQQWMAFWVKEQTE